MYILIFSFLCSRLSRGFPRFNTHCGECFEVKKKRWTVLHTTYGGGARAVSPPRRDN